MSMISVQVPGSETHLLISVKQVIEKEGDRKMFCKHKRAVGLLILAFDQIPRSFG